jgi:hypothetical protein
MAGGDTVTAMELVVNAIRSQLIYIDRIHELQERLDHAERRLRSANRVLAKIADDNEAAAEAGQRAEGTQALGLHVPCETCGRCKGCGNCKCEAPAKEYRFHSN